jgi:2-keto-3-deoxy-L-rhamnonate aldolase RhmA
MRGRELRAALHAGQRVYGTALTGYHQPQWPRLFAGLGLDFVFIDNEHTPMNRETLAWACEAYAAHGVAPLLRIPEPSATLAAMALDGGAHGVIVPYVETVEQVRQVVGAVRYRPLKGQALEHVLDTGEFPSADTAAELDAINRDSLLVIMIESPAGVDHLDALLGLGNVDAVLIGPHDFSISHGIPQDYDHPLFEERVKQVIAVCQAHHVGVGIHYIGGSLERAVTWVQWGTNFISHRADTLYITRSIEHEIGHLRRTLDGDLPPAPPEPTV